MTLRSIDGTAPCHTDPAYGGMSDYAAQQSWEAGQRKSLANLQRVSALNYEDFLAKEFPPRENLMAPWLPAQGLAMLYGPRGAGKTHVAMGVCWAVASGGAFLRWTTSGSRRWAMAGVNGTWNGPVATTTCWAS